MIKFLIKEELSVETIQQRYALDRLHLETSLQIKPIQI